MDLQTIKTYLNYGIKAHVKPLMHDELIVTIAGATNDSIITDNGVFFKLADTKPYLMPIGLINEFVDDEQFGNVQLVDLISMTRQDKSVFTADAKSGHFRHKDLKHWQFERLAKHHLDFMQLIPKGLALDKTTMHDD